MLSTIKTSIDDDALMDMAKQGIKALTPVIKEVSQPGKDKAKKKTSKKTSKKAVNEAVKTDPNLAARAFSPVETPDSGAKVHL